MKILWSVMAMAVIAWANVGEISVVKGDAHVDRAAEQIKAVNALPLLGHDTVITQKGRLQMRFRDNTVISLGNDSIFAIDEYLYDDGSNADPVASFSIKQGFLKAVTGLIGKYSPKKFSVSTNSAVVRVKGTIWSVLIEEGHEIFAVIDGRISVTYRDKSGAEHTRELGAGERMKLYTDVNAPQRVEMIKRVETKAGQSSEAGYKYRYATTPFSESEAGTMAEEQKMNKGTSIGPGGTVVTPPGTGYGGNSGYGNDPKGQKP